MPETIYPNQRTAANRCFNALSEDTNSIVLAAETQSGKTGAIYFLLERLWDRDKTTKFLVFGPSDKELRRQTQERLMESNKISQSLIGSNVWHHPDLAKQTVNSLILERQIAAMRATNTPIVVVHDEAHIAIGDKQKLLEFYENILGTIPDPNGLPGNISFVMISATPFSQDVANFKQIFLVPGDGYQGLNDFVENGLISDIGNPPKNKSKKAQYKNKIQEIISRAYDKNDKGYFVIRATTTFNKNYVEPAIHDLEKQGKKINYQTFLSAKKNIEEFGKVLSQGPPGFNILGINQAYKQGKTLNKHFICGWLENCSKSRNEADLIQSIGRNFGYDANLSYNIYCDLNKVKEAQKYYEAAKYENKQDMSQVAMSDGHTKAIEKVKTIMKKDIHASLEEARSFLAENGFTGTRMTCTLNGETDIAAVILNEGNRNQRKGNKLNIYHLDAPHPNFLESWSKLDSNLHGKFVTLLPLEKKNIVTRRTSSMFGRYVA